MKDGPEPALYVEIAEMIDDHRYEQAMAEAALQQTVQLTRIADALARLAAAVHQTRDGIPYLYTTTRIAE